MSRNFKSEIVRRKSKAHDFGGKCELVSARNDVMLRIAAQQRLPLQLLRRIARQRFELGAGEEDGSLPVRHQDAVR